MDARIQNDLELIKESVLQAVPAEAIYLFGSYAYGTPNEESDLDVYVVVPDDTTDLGELYADIYELLWKKKTVSLDLLMGHSSVFNRRKNGPTLERVIAQKGAVLYGT
ncbi:MAG: nucleotidyltransferase domain-containing protein [Oscillospiraceae bacterium]|nr:nucleotidyltransferase domain-containing protein [Oscillospiraceae bacterium]